jgi:glycine/D-amino acid oxidase-like deaminating enzyme
MRVAILGGGFQGCCTALALARRGISVTLYDRHPTLLAGAATASEGKIHLGYVYASDRSLATGRTMLRGALSFSPLVQTYLDAAVPLATSEPFAYAVHRDSQVNTEDFAKYLDAMHALVALAPNSDSYFGIDLGAPPRRLTQAALENRFDPDYVTAAFDTAEIAIDTVAIAEKMRRRIVQDPRIDVRTGCRITAVEDNGDRLRVRSAGNGSDEADSDTYGSVVNALWDGRLAIDATRSIHPGRKWIHRFKHGIRFCLSNEESLASVTLVLGPFGDLVAYGDGLFYVSWYPTCMTARSEALVPPDWLAEPDEPLRSRIVTESLAAMGAIVPTLRRVQPKNIAVKAGVIVAWGSTDIDDHGSELHRRYEIGVHSYGGYHSIDPGKLTMAPHFAEVCAERILPTSAP